MTTTVQFSDVYYCIRLIHLWTSRDIHTHTSTTYMLELWINVRTSSTFLHEEEEYVETYYLWKETKIVAPVPAFVDLDTATLLHIHGIKRKQLRINWWYSGRWVFCGFLVLLVGARARNVIRWLVVTPPSRCHFRPMEYYSYVFSILFNIFIYPIIYHYVNGEMWNALFCETQEAEILAKALLLWRKIT